MAEQRETTILDVQLDAGKVADELSDIVGKIQDLKAEQRELTQAIKDGEDADGKYAKRLMEVKDQLAWNEKQAKGLAATTKLLAADSTTYSDTLNGQRQKLADMQKAYASLDKAQRDGKGGEVFRKAIEEQHEAVLKLEKGIGQSQRNVGNYPQILGAVIPSFTGFTGKLGGMTEAIKGMGSSAPKAFSAMAGGIKQATIASLQFIATPIGAIITAIVATVKVAMVAWDKLAEAFKKNDAAGTNLSRLLSSFTPIISIVNKAFDALATILGNVAGAIADVIASMSDEAKAAQALVTSIDDLEEKERDYTVNSAKRARDIARLRAEASDSKDVETRKAKLREAIELEKANLAEEKAIAQQRLDNLVKEAKQNVDTSDETAKKIADAKAALFAAEQKYYTDTRRLNKELSGADNERAASAKRASEEIVRKREEEAKRLAAIAKKQAEDERDISRMAEDFRTSQISDDYERAREQRRINGERELQELEERLSHANDAEVQMTDAAQSELAQLIKDKRAALYAELDAMEATHTEEQAQRERDEQIYIAEQRKEMADSIHTESADDELRKLDEQFAAQKELWQLQFDEEMNNIDLTEAEKAALRDKWNALMLESTLTYDEQRNAIERKKDDEMLKQKRAMTKAYKGVLDTLAGGLADYEEESKAAAIISKSIALGEIAVNTGTALAKGISQAQSVPFPANIAAIATTISTIMANVFSAIKMVSSAKFSGGGVVGGGSYGQGDTVHAMLSPQEVVLNPTQTAQTLFAIANGGAIGQGSNNAQLAEMLANAVAQLPAPVMDYKEFTDFTDRVTRYNELSKI